MIRIRGGRGLGDSLYLRPIVDHLVCRGKRVVALSDYPDVFADSGAAVEPFSRTGVTVLAHYTAGKANPQTTQWQDILASARIDGALPLRFVRAVKNTALVADLKAQAGNRPIIVVHGGRVPMGRSDGFGMELLPRKETFDCVLAALSDCFLVRIGKAPLLYPLNVDVDLNGSTSISDLLDIAVSADCFVAQCSFAAPLAEVFGKPLLAIWSASGLKSKTQFIAQITPRKILTNKTSSHVVDDWPTEKITECIHAFRAVL